MLLPIKPILDRRPRRNGTNLISIQYCFSSDKRTVLYTGISVPARFWNKNLSRISQDLPAQYGKADQLNLKLQSMIRMAEDIVAFAMEEGMEDPMAFLKRTFQPDFDLVTLPDLAKQFAQSSNGEKIVNLDFFHQYDSYIKSKSRKVSVGMVRTYNVIKQRPLAFQKHRKQKITFESFDYNFYESLVNYLTYEHTHLRRTMILRGLKRNSVGTTNKQLRIFLRDRVRRKIIASIDLTDFKILDEETDAIYLTVQEIRALYTVDLSAHPEWGRFRDMFVLGCFTGLRFSDYSSIRPEDIRKVCFIRNKVNPTIGLLSRYAMRLMTYLSTDSIRKSLRPPMPS